MHVPLLIYMLISPMIRSFTFSHHFTFYSFYRHQNLFWCSAECRVPTVPSVECGMPNAECRMRCCGVRSGVQNGKVDSTVEATVGRVRSRVRNNDQRWKFNNDHQKSALLYRKSAPVPLRCLRSSVARISDIRISDIRISGYPDIRYRISISKVSKVRGVAGPVKV